MNSSTILSRAADIIEERGLVTGRYSGKNGEVCPAKAVYLAAGSTRLAVRDAVPTENLSAANRAMIALAHQLASPVGEDPFPPPTAAFLSGEREVVSWTDTTPGLTKKTVAEQLRKAGARLRAVSA